MDSGSFLAFSRGVAINLFHLKVPSFDGYHHGEIDVCQVFF